MPASGLLHIQLSLLGVQFLLSAVLTFNDSAPVSLFSPLRSPPSYPSLGVQLFFWPPNAPFIYPGSTHNIIS